HTQAHECSHSTFHLSRGGRTPGVEERLNCWKRAKAMSTQSSCQEFSKSYYRLLKVSETENDCPRKTLEDNLGQFSHLAILPQPLGGLVGYTPGWSFCSQIPVLCAFIF